MFKDTFDPKGILKALKESRWTRIFFNQRGEAGVDEGFEGTAIPESYKESPIGKYATIGDLAKGYGEAQKLIGAKGVILPTDKSTPEEVTKFNVDLGMPEKPEGYKLSTLENMHPKLEITAETEVGFKALMHKHGITAKQADGLYKDYFGMMSTSLTKGDEVSGAAKHEAETALRTAWGGEYDNNLSKAKRLVMKFGGADAAEAFGELGNNPAVLKTIASIASKFSEDGFIKGDKVVNVEAKEAQQKITDIMLDKKHSYWVAGPGHAEAVAEMRRLQTIVHPEVEA